MIVAGGSVVVAACGGSQVTAGDASDDGMTVGSSGGPNFCCNANSDPCCQYQYCGGDLTSACAAKMECIAEGGTWGDLYQGIGCMFAVDAGTDAPADAPIGDAPVDSPVYGLDAFCCNANPDPCCPYLHCGEALSSRCSEELACQAEGGTYDPFFTVQPDGSLANLCSFPAPEGGPPDAGDAGGE
jgi:hypothetical protein